MPQRETARHALRRDAASPPDVLGAMQSRLRQSQRENDDLRRQITRLNCRLEVLFQHQSPMQEGID